MVKAVLLEPQCPNCKVYRPGLTVNTQVLPRKAEVTGFGQRRIGWTHSDPSVSILAQPSGFQVKRTER